MKKVSVYIKGGQSSPGYYRIYQYLNNIDGCKFDYHTMLSVKMHDKVMPISKQPVWVKVGCLGVMYLRGFKFLAANWLKRPDALIISRRVINRVMPPSFKFFLRRISKTTPIIWDYDDDIITGREVSRKTFDFYAEISSKIFCTHRHLADMIPERYRNKVQLLPTTDGDMFRRFENSDTNVKRLESLKEVLKLVWVATNVNLPHIQVVAPWLDKAAQKIKEISGRDTELAVICNGELDYSFKHLKLKNIRWTREKAIQGMFEAHIGIMPLQDTTYAKGKGAFKLVQYISVGLPCIGSDVGFNRDALQNGAGLLVKNEDDWVNAILEIADPEKWRQFSDNAFKHWQHSFSFENNLKVWQEALAETK